MPRSRLPDPVCVPIGLTVTGDDAARIDQVLARPEFAGWTRAEWCLEIVRTALRYYVGEPAAGEAAQAPAPPARGAPARGAPAPAEEALPVMPEEEAPAVAEEEATPERRYCSHPADARDYETGTCAACGAILWD